MGQKCCRPTMRIDPKYIDLLTLIYAQSPESQKQPDYPSIANYLAKKGQVKMLSDYLSSHLRQIHPSLIICRNKQVSFRNRNRNLQIYYSVVTTEITIRIIWLCREIKSKQEFRMRSLIKQEENKTQLPVLNIKTDKVSEKKTNKRMQSLIKKKPKSIVTNPQFTQTEIGNTILEIYSEVTKQTINGKKQIPLESRGTKIQATEYRILSNIQMILAKLLDFEGDIRFDFKSTKNVLDELINIISMCKIPSDRKDQRMVPSHARQSETAPSQIKQIKLSQMDKAQGQQFSPTISNGSKNEKYKMAKDCLSNYNSLMSFSTMYMLSANLYRDLAKVHLPKLLDYWAHLVVEVEREHKQRAELQSIREEKSSIDNSDNNFNQFYWLQSAHESIDLIKEIMKQFFNSYFTSGESNYVYKELIIIFDRLLFNEQLIAPIENLFFQSLKNYELRESVMSKWFEYLLDYLGAIIICSADTSSSAVKNQQSQIYERRSSILNPNINAQTNNYLGSLNLPFTYENIKQYGHTFAEESICGCLKTIQRWIQSGEVNLENILNYKRTKFFVSVLANLARGNPQIKQQVIQTIQFLIDNDVRCFGYLIDTAIFFIGKLKMPFVNSMPEYTWNYYIENWSKNQQNQQNQVLNTSVTWQFGKDRKSISTPSLKIKIPNTQGLQLVSVQNFVEEVIFVSSLPFLGNFMNKMIECKINNGFIDELKKQQAHFSVLVIGEHDRQLQKKPTSRYSEVLDDPHQSLESPTRNKLLRSNSLADPQKHHISSTNLYVKSVLQQTVSVLYKGINLLSNYVNVNSAYQVKLSGLVLASNFKTMVCLASIASEKSQLNFIVSLCSKVCKFMAKNYTQIKMICEDRYIPIIQINESRIKNQQKDEESQHNFLKFLQNESDSSSDREFEQSSLDILQMNKKNLVANYVNLQHVKMMQRAVHTWIYPTLHYVLISTKINSNQYDDLNLELVQQGTKQNRIYLKILVNIVIKIYFKNLLSLSQQVIQMHKKSFQMQKQIENYNQIQSRFSENQSKMNQQASKVLKKNTIDKKQASSIRQLNANQQILDTGEKEDQWNQLYFLPVRELLELFVLFSHESVISDNQVDDVWEEKPQLSLKRQRRYSFKTTSSKKLDEIAVNQTQKSSLFVEQVKKCIEEMKILNNKQKLFQQCKETNAMNSVVNSAMKSTGTPSQCEQKNSDLIIEQKKIMSFVEEIIYSQKFSNSFFRFVDNTSSFNDEVSRKNHDQIALKRAAQKIVSTELLKNVIGQKGTPIQQDIEEKTRCDFFRKAFKKIYDPTPRQAQNVEEKNHEKIVSQQSIDSKALKKKNEHLGHFQEMTEKNAHIVIPQIIEKLEQLYDLKEEQYPVGAQNNKEKDHFILVENDFNPKQSEFASDSNPGDDLSSSFGQMFVEIRKH